MNKFDDSKLPDSGDAKANAQLIVANDKLRKMVLFFLLVVFLTLAYLSAPLIKAKVLNADTTVTPMTESTETPAAESAPVTDESTPATEPAEAPATTN